MAAKSTVIGIDLGSSDSYVAYVGKGIVDLAQNEVSQRKTPTMVGFKDRERLVGDAAHAQAKSNFKNTCRNFKHLLGRQLKDVGEESFWSTSKLETAFDNFVGYEVSYKGEQINISATQVTAMFIVRLKEIAEAWCNNKVTDAVIAVPSHFSDVERQALLDAAHIAGIPILRLMNEHTATALAYGIYRSNDFDAEKPCTVAFCSVGHVIFSVSIVQFFKGRLQVLCERSEKTGGRDMDDCLLRECAARFKKETGCDALASKKAVLKLEDAVMKTKKTLSANSEANISCECLLEDRDFACKITRKEFQEWCEPMMNKVKKVLDSAIAASGLPVEQIDFVEMVGGASRVPWVKEMCSAAFAGKDLSSTLNADECVARGCALQAAILSPLYKVRDFKVEDKSPYAVTVKWDADALDASLPPASEIEDTTLDHAMPAAGKDGEKMRTVLFPELASMNTSKTLTFYRKRSFTLMAEYEEPTKLPVGVDSALGTWTIDIPEQQAPKKVRVRAKLGLSGRFSIEEAAIEEIEEYEEMVKERRELSPEPEEKEEPEKEGPKNEEAATETETKAAEPETKAAEPEQAAEEQKATEDVPMPDAGAVTVQQAPETVEPEAKEDKKEEDKKEDKKEDTKEDRKEDRKEDTEEKEEKAAEANEEAKPETTTEADKMDTSVDAPQDKNSAEQNGDKKDGAEKASGEEKKAGSSSSSSDDAEVKEAEPPKKKARQPPAPRFEWIDVVRTKQRVKRQDIGIISSFGLGLSPEELQKRMDEETMMQAEQREIRETDEKRNDLESYIFNMRDKITENGLYGKFISAEARESFNTELQKMEDWLYDTFDASKVMYLDKLDELKTIGDPIVWRSKESERRHDWVEALRGTVKNYRKAAEEPGENYGHIDTEKLKKVVDHCQEASMWLEDLVTQQEKLPLYQKPVILCAEVEKRNQEVAKFCDKILREPKPPPKEEPKPPAKEETKLPKEKAGKKAKKAKVQPAAAAEDDEAAEAEAKENGSEAPAAEADAEAEVEVEAEAEEPAKNPPAEPEAKDHAAEDADMVD